ncbi:DE-cadherin isoform X2 [Neocloeon triangulifer]|uniref:DE-cadherin isoform X2 n=1 Tax=Neocloeon triangulifer TaxID=2078957 RepID=UPI00286FAE0D|nr:DE-cadherin isoform X2 [Neocloeon triangulifer]
MKAAFVCLAALLAAAHAVPSADRFGSGVGGGVWHASKLRHSRHLSGRSGNHGPNPAQDDYFNSFNKPPGTPLWGKAEIHNNRKPVFSNCPKYTPSVKEEEEPGTKVLTVQAQDRDPDDTITYTFIVSPGERQKFNINNKTGEITTRQVFDRDEPTREKEAFITVRATDNGKPPLDDVCVIKVTIEDTNDNKPVFDKGVYRESVPQDMRPGSEVMRISATDIDDGKNSIVEYELHPIREEERGYFRVDRSTGVITLNRTIDIKPPHVFRLNATATDQGTPSQSSSTELEIVVVDSNKKPPSYTKIPESPLMLQENFNDYGQVLATFQAQSNIPERELVFTIVPGRTEQTNKQNTFLLESEGESAYLKLGGQLDYERITEYVITIRVQNKYNLAAETVLNIAIEDVNDNIPIFRDVAAGTVLEHELPGAPVMQVRAFDADGTYKYNQVTYELGDHQDLFEIDEYTGNITTKVTFDREEKDSYVIKVIAKDNFESALLQNGQPNKGQQSFHIIIGDTNDNPPKFTKKTYIAEAVENANLNALVTEVRAVDNDTASEVFYSIESGNPNDQFKIEKNTGKIRVNKELDYETTTSYTLEVRAFDGIYEDRAFVQINIENVNDEPPVFLEFHRNVTIPEEEMREGCIIKVEAYDPDLPRDQPQRIRYYIVKEEQKKLLSIDYDGCISLIKPLDRDPPNGYERWQILINAKDEDGEQNSLQSPTEVEIILTDINDNAPYLNVPQPVIWPENTDPGVITTLTAEDNDDHKKGNGPPFHYELDPYASDDIRNGFKVTGNSDTSFKIETIRQFDREQQKTFYVPIVISDSGTPSQTGTSTLTVVIGDENDNPMRPGSSEIFVYNYKGLSNSVIGRVFVEDEDDWDLPDKTFGWKSGEHRDKFQLDEDTGEISVMYNPAFENDLEGTFDLEFVVYEESFKIPRHSVDAFVKVVIKKIPEVAIDRSGSIRLANTTAEEFIEHSKREDLTKYIASLFNISVENVDVFTALNSKNGEFLDVRFSAHSSPYYQPEKINGKLAEHQLELEALTGGKVHMVNIDECLIEKSSCESSCMNLLVKHERPQTVWTNRTSFVGVHAEVQAECVCSIEEENICYNGGTSVGPYCECPEGYNGPRCEVIDVGFSGDGYAWYPTLAACERGQISLELTANNENGLLFYVGPIASTGLKVQDFMSLEVSGGYPKLLVDYGTGTASLEQNKIKIADGHPHHIVIKWGPENFEMVVDSCTMGTCMSVSPPAGINKFLNVNGPLQVGGTSKNLGSLGAQLGWTYTPTSKGFHGCISNFTFNGKVYNLGEPSYSKNASPGCSRILTQAVTFGIDTNFLVALLVCIAVLLILVLAVVVHKRRSDDMYKDHDDIRENIINYEDEGGGEGDMTGYDLNVLRLHYDGDLKKPHDLLGSSRPHDEVPDICGFLDGKKRQVDEENSDEPVDNLRHYAYEGDGNSTGSLSSLASGTDDGDLNFEYLSDFGPRFRKLADMYGEHSSDESEGNFEAPGSESWC